MLKKYEDLNESAKNYILEELNKIEKDKLKLKRCYKEVDILYDINLLPIIKYLYIYKKGHPSIKYFFRGTINNLLVLYILKLSNVDSIKYNLDYEIFNCGKSSQIELCIINEKVNDFINEINTIQKDFIIEKNNNLLHDYDGDNCYSVKLDKNCEPYITPIILLDTKNNTTYIYSKEAKRIIETINPSNEEECIKCILLDKSVGTWKNNQEDLFKKHILNVNQLISCSEDVYSYLIHHNFSVKESFKIMRFIKYGYAADSEKQKEWNNYIKIMKEHNCEDLFIEVCSKILYLWPKGHETSLYLLAIK